MHKQKPIALMELSSAKCACKRIWDLSYCCPQSTATNRWLLDCHWIGCVDAAILQRQLTLYTCQSIANQTSKEFAKLYQAKSDRGISTTTDGAKRGCDSRQSSSARAWKEKVECRRQRLFCTVYCRYLNYLWQATCPEPLRSNALSAFPSPRNSTGVGLHHVSLQRRNI